MKKEFRTLTSVTKQVLKTFRCYTEINFIFLKLIILLGSIMLANASACGNCHLCLPECEKGVKASARFVPRKRKCAMLPCHIKMSVMHFEVHTVRETIKTLSN